jgi:dihydrofolate reductase
MANYVYIGTSIDGYIADREGGLGWLDTVPNPENIDTGFSAFMERVDAVVMGRNTYETVLGFGGEWPYPKPVFVCSRTLREIPERLNRKVFLIQGSPEEMTEQLKAGGYENLYIDGGRTIQGFLRDDLIDEMIISRIPVLLGGGTPLFADLPEHRAFEFVSTELVLDQIVSTRYRRKV